MSKVGTSIDLNIANVQSTFSNSPQSDQRVWSCTLDAVSLQMSFVHGLFYSKQFDSP